MLEDPCDKAVMLRRVMNFGYISIEACVLLAVFLPIFVQMLLTNIECGSGVVSVVSVLLFVCVCNNLHVLKCLRKCSEVDRRRFVPSTCCIHISC
jgi:hypothetical protein